MPAFNKKTFNKAISDMLNKGGHKVLIIGIILLLVPLLLVIFLPDRLQKTPRDKLELAHKLTQRKNVFNFGEKSRGGSSILPFGLGSSGSGITVEQQVADELSAAVSRLKATKPKLHFPPDITPEQRMACEAEYNLNLRNGRGAFEAGRFDEAERLYFAAFSEAKDNPFLQVYALGGLCQLYETIGDVEKYKRAFAQYLEKCKLLPPELQGKMLAQHVQDLYTMLAAVKKEILSPRVAQEIADSPYAKYCDKIDGGLAKGIERNLDIFPISD